MKKSNILRVVSLVMLIAAILFFGYALGHPEGSFPISRQVTYACYCGYFGAMFGLFAASFLNKD